jgi:hypothetical protein
MIVTTMTYLLTFCFAMVLMGLAITAYEFRRMSNLQSRRTPRALQTAPEMTPVRVRVRARRTR